MTGKRHLTLVAPTSVNRTVPPLRPLNEKLRTREHLLPAEVEKLVATSKRSRYPQRDATLILVVYRHGLRAVEACDLEWSQVDFDTATLHVRRVKNGKSATHPIRGDELRALRQLRRAQDSQSTFVFMTERGAPFTPDALNCLVKRLGVKAALGLPVHAHMLRHSCGYPLRGYQERAATEADRSCCSETD